MDGSCCFYLVNFFIIGISPKIGIVNQKWKKKFRLAKQVKQLCHELNNGKLKGIEIKNGDLTVSI